MYIGRHVKYPLFLSDFSETLIFSTGFRKILISDFMKNRCGSRVVPCRRPDGHEANSRFYANGLKSTGEGGK